MLSIALVLLAVALGVLGVGIATRRERPATEELEQRLERFGSVDHHPVDPNSVTKSPSAMARAVDRAVEGRGFSKNIAALLARSSVKMTVGEFLVIRGATAAGGFLMGFVLARGLSQPLLGVFGGLVGVIIGWMLPHWYMGHRAKKRTKQFVNQLGDTISLMANSLRAGYSLLQTLEMISRESPAPMSEEFDRVVREVGLGISAQEALAHLLRRVPSEDLDLLVTAINIQHEVGGNLAQILEVIGETIRERVRIKGEISVLTAQQSLSGYIISALPVLLAGFLFIINPSYVGSMFTIPWVCMPIGGAVLIIIGFLAMRKIVQIDV